MTTPVRIVIPGRPVPFQRARSQGGQRYNDPRYADWKDRAGWLMKAARVRFDGPVAVTVEVTAGGLGVAFSEADRVRPKGVRGDLDNYLKAVLDAANRIVYEDDRQVVGALVEFGDEP